jgi:hypothetical protein
MNAKTLIGLGVATAALFAAAIVVNNQKEGAHSPTREAGKKLFPELAKNVNAVTALEVTSKDGVVKLAKSGERWGVADKGGYPVDFDKVKQIVVAVSEFEILMELSKNPANYKKLGVLAPDAEGSDSKRLTLKDANGAVLADVIIGGPKTSQGFGGKPSLYVRAATSERPYEVSGSVNQLGDASTWMKREITKLEANRVKSVVISHPDGARLAIAKATAEETNYAVEDLPAGEELMWAGAANPIAGALQYLSLEDVKPAAEMTLENPTVAEFTTFDGMRVTVRTTEAEGKTWMSVAAAFDESLRAEPAGPAPAPETAEGEAPPTPASTLKSVEDVRKEVDELNAQLSKWVYAVPGYNGANFRKRMPDLLKKKEEGAAADGAPLDDAALDGAAAPQTPVVPPATEPTQPSTPPADGAGAGDGQAQGGDAAPTTPPTTPPATGGGR